MSESHHLIPQQNAESYLGDGLYISFDGWHIKLRAPRPSGDHFVGLDPEVYQAMLKWVARYPALWERFAIEAKRRA